MEGMTRLNAALSLAVAHARNVDHTRPENHPINGVHDSASLPERANAFSVLFVLHKTWSIALQWPAVMPDLAVRFDGFSPGALNSADAQLANEARLARSAKAAFLYSRAAALHTESGLFIFQEVCIRV